MLAEIIHEMGHVFASKVAPDECNEYDFFGWEIAMVKHIGLPLKDWIYEQSNYAVSEDPLDEKSFAVELRDLSGRTLDLLILERLHTAQKNGLISEHDEPLCIRK